MREPSSGGSAIGAAGLTIKPESAEATETTQTIPTTVTQFRCPVCNKDFSSFAELKEHFRTAHPEHVVPVKTKLNVNGEDCEVLIEPHWTLQRTLQYKLGLSGAKQMCDRGACGSCTVIMDGRAILSCNTLAVECEGKAIQTIEGIAADPKYKPLIDSYCKWDAMQCGYCTPGVPGLFQESPGQEPQPDQRRLQAGTRGQYLHLWYLSASSHRDNGSGAENS